MQTQAAIFHSSPSLPTRPCGGASWLEEGASANVLRSLSCTLRRLRFSRSRSFSRCCRVLFVRPSLWPDRSAMFQDPTMWQWQAYQCVAPARRRGKRLLRWPTRRKTARDTCPRHLPRFSGRSPPKTFWQEPAACDGFFGRFSLVPHSAIAQSTSLVKLEKVSQHKSKKPAKTNTSRIIL